MKNFLDLPRREDFFKTTFLDLTQPDFQSHYREKDIRHKRGFVNMRNIIDLSEFNLTIKVIDEEKMPDFKEQMKLYSKNNLSSPTMPYPNPMAPYYSEPNSTLEIEMPVIPTKDVTIKGTTILYFNGVARIIMCDFKEFENEYFNYLQKEKLDF